MNKIFNVILIFAVLYGCSHIQEQSKKEELKVLEQAFQNPPESARTWVYWFWINGNITKEGITADLEAMKEVGVGGVLWMEVSGPWWAPDGQVKPYSTQWNDLMQWAIQESDRLGLKFDISVDFGYGSGGPHITPDISMQKLYWSETMIDGGKKIDMTLKRPEIFPEKMLKEHG